MGFLFGDPALRLQPVLTDARRVGDLGKVLADDRATDHLLATRNLDESLENRDDWNEARRIMWDCDLLIVNAPTFDKIHENHINTI